MISICYAVTLWVTLFGQTVTLAKTPIGGYFFDMPKLEFSQDDADVICTRLAEGKSLRSICADDDDLPAISTIFKWLSLHPSFADQYARARDAQADTLFDEILDIADERVTPEYTAQQRLRYEARRWMVGKLRPKKYGDKQEIEHSGAVEITTKEQRDAAVAAALNADG
jgi:hypothetical protein